MIITLGLVGLSEEFHFAIHEVDRRTMRHHTRPHKQNGIIDILLVTEGKLRHRINNREFLHRPRDLILVRGSDTHETLPSKVSMLIITLEESRFVRLLSDCDQEREAHILLKEDFLIKKQLEPTAFEKLLLELKELQLNQKKRESNILFYQFLLALYVDHIGNFVSHYKGKALPDWLLTAITFSRNKVHQGIQLNELYTICNRSKEHVSRTFKKELGVSPSTFLNDLRLERAAVKLSTSMEAVNEIALSLGYENMSYFYKQFKKKYNMSPGYYRKKKNILW